MVNLEISANWDFIYLHNSMGNFKGLYDLCFCAKQSVSLGVIGSLAKDPLFERLWQTSLWKTDELMCALIELEGRCSSKAVLKNS